MSDAKFLHNRNSGRSQKSYLTTGQAAKVAGVAPRTVTKWADSGAIEGTVRLPLSKDRRIPISGFVKFLKQYGLQVPEALLGSLTIACGVEFGPADSHIIRHECTLIEFGMFVAPDSFPIARFLVGDIYGIDYMIQMVRAIHRVHKYCELIGVLSEGTNQEVLAVEDRKLMNALVQKPVNWNWLQEKFNFSTHPINEGPVA